MARQEEKANDLFCSSDKIAGDGVFTRITIKCSKVEKKGDNTREDEDMYEHMMEKENEGSSGRDGMI